MIVSVRKGNKIIKEISQIKVETKEITRRIEIFLFLGIDLRESVKLAISQLEGEAGLREVTVRERNWRWSLE